MMRTAFIWKGAGDGISKSSSVGIILPFTLLLSHISGLLLAILANNRGFFLRTDITLLTSLLKSRVHSSTMAPIIIRRVLDSSIWSALDASKPKLSRRGTYGSGVPAVFVIPFSIVLILILFGCCIRGQRAKAAKARSENRVVSLT